MEDWYLIAEEDLPDSPALLVYPDRVKYNVDLLVNSIDDVGRLRPHIKTHKCRESVQLCMEAGITKFKCATIAEAEMLAMCRVTDALLAYQPTGPKAGRLISLIKKYPQTSFSCLVDNDITAEQLHEQAQTNQLKIKVYVDLNVGMNRSGILPQDAFELYQYCAGLSGLKVNGLHIYDGHIHDENVDTRKERVNTSFAPVEDLISQLKEFGLHPRVIAGGTPTYPIYSGKRDIECSPGTFIYWDYGYQQSFKEQPYLTAALVLTRVVSLPGENRICVDLGHKSVGAENIPEKRVRFLNAPELKFIGQSEEHLVLDAGVGHKYKIGDVLYGLPYHICPTVALYGSAIAIINKKVSGEWITLARERKINL